VGHELGGDRNVLHDETNESFCEVKRGATAARSAALGARAHLRIRMTEAALGPS
jgi:hypothetical protein